ncbi:MAG: hypothetical protein K2L16_08050 [Muribaculaceae bacterium]|nr:hypothetical protein [Muribaculaceae bacterium]
MKRFRILLAALFVAALSAAAAVNDGGYTVLKPKFTWGADVGASIDMSGNDMSSLDVDITFGMRRGWLNFLGFGVGADIMVSNSCRSFPLFAELRTNFVDRPTVAFWDLRLGASLNYLEHNHQQTGFFGFTGVGFNLARSAKFSSHLMLGYTFRQRSRVEGPEMTHPFHDLHYASVKIGVSF